MMGKFKDKLSKIVSSGVNNKSISARQKLIFKAVIITIVAIILGLFVYIQEKRKISKAKQKPVEVEHTKLELPDSTIDAEKRWRDHFEKLIAMHKRDMDDRLKIMEDSQSKLISKANEAVERELKETKEKLKMAQEELVSASLDLKRVAEEEEARINANPPHEESNLTMQEIGGDIQYDLPKSAENYIPEGTYFTGNLLGGIVVSTALNTAQENAVPVVIRLTGRGNLSKHNKLNIKNCIIKGGAYGDKESQRVIMRLEKLVCLRDGLYQTSLISGQIFGPDGYNGIKGKMVSTSNQHIMNAMLGSLIGGLSSSSKQQESFLLTGGGALSTKKHNIGDMLGNGALDGVSNAGDMVAKHFLKLAESMSPVLMVKNGVKVNPQITTGFFIGEVGTHKKIKQSKR